MTVGGECNGNAQGPIPIRKIADVSSCKKMHDYIVEEPYPTILYVQPKRLQIIFLIRTSLPQLIYINPYYSYDSNKT